ncbi:retrovirus-related Pol polyprotein from transposon 412 [Trichonephila clavipes]|nr:retrovirus-related Pol polyprotein from transposon 412 [Trichonephila clavipes]
MIVRPLHKLTEAEQKFIWTFDYSSRESIEAVLSQEIDGQERVIAYFSKCLSKPERNYCVTRKDLLAIYQGQVARWIQRLQEYDVEIRHRKGSTHENADALSRRPCPESCKYCSRIEKKFGVIDSIVHQVTTPSTSALNPWSDESIRKDQPADPEIKPILEFKESSDEKPNWQDITSFHPTANRYWALWDSLHLRNGVLYRKWETEDGKKFRNKVRIDVEKCCRICDPCAARKGPRKRTRGRLQLYNVGAPFERIAFDILGPLPRSSDGNNNILVVMDYFTKWPEVYPIPDQEASTIAEVLVQH